MDMKGEYFVKQLTFFVRFW